MRHIIVGAGPAGVAAAETLRQTDANAEITLIGSEPEPPYSRMAIPYVLTGGIGEDGTYLRKTDGHFDTLNIKVMQARAQSVTPVDCVIEMEDGEKLEYDRLLVATGSHPIKPPVPGLDLDGVYHCWTLADAREIAKRAAEGSDVVLMGAGFIGSIILESLAERGVNLTVVEADDRMVPRMMNDTAGGMIKKWCIEKGVNVLTSTRITDVSESGASPDGLAISLDNGDTLNAALLVVAAGVAPNADFLDGTGIEMDSGIIVDNHLQSSIDNIYAAGDVAQGPDFSTDGTAVHAVQPTAVEHGRIAALNMAGVEANYKGSLSMNVIDTLGLVSTSFGLWHGVDGGEHAEQVVEAANRYLRLEFEGDRIVGAITIGRTDHIGVLRGLISARIALGPWKEKLMDDPQLIADAYIACTQG